jgi:LytS/YehU family sensor histidine kinase
LYLHKQYVYYFTVIGLLLVTVWWLQPFDHFVNQHPPRFDNRPPSFGPGPPPHGHRGQRIDIVSIVLFFTVWSVSMAMQTVKQWRRTEQRAARAEADKAQAELSFLKAQINPHFLFNTLNNIYSLSVSNSADTPAAILKLSNIMRYVTDEASQNFVPLQNEVNCATDYIDLQRLRLSDKVTIDYSVMGTLEGKEIAPLLLMTFIENLFKYGVSNHEPSPIVIQLMADEKAIHFSCQNRIFSTQRKTERTGIGLANTKQRLEHLYPYRHLLSITRQDNLYTVQLTLQA